ncbi:hypothetical protein TNCV_984051 [Trichonephila clavipes]|nr:hypothetical protein TNCV_984051 [Trichonephila clavipes]
MLCGSIKSSKEHPTTEQILIEEWALLSQVILTILHRLWIDRAKGRHCSKLQNLDQKYAFLRPVVILNMDELSLDKGHEDTNKEEFQLEHVRLQAFVAAIDPGCKKEIIRSGSLGLLKYIIE